MSEPDRLVDVGGRRLRVRSLGEGSPTVVLEAGMGETLETWRLVQPALAGVTRTVSYDRAGLGGSDPVGRPRAFDEMSDDLRALLGALGAPGPYVLVGHSLGGLIVRVYAARYPAEVGGVVLVASPHHDYMRRALPILGPPIAGEGAAVTEARTFFETILAGREPPAVEREGERVLMAAGYRQVPGDGSLGGLPLRVVLAGKPVELGPDFPPATAAAIREMLLGSGRELADLSTRGDYAVAEASGHMVQLDAPDAVIAAVQAVVGLSQELEPLE